MHLHFQRGMSLSRKQEMGLNLVAVMSVFWFSATAEELRVRVPDSLIQAESEVGKEATPLRLHSQCNVKKSSTWHHQIPSGRQKPPFPSSLGMVAGAVVWG